MSDIVTHSATMTSREIADLTGKLHQHVKRDIENMLVELQIDVTSFGRIYLDSMNRQQTEFSLDRDLTENLLMGYSAPLRRAVLARLRELEELARPVVPVAAIPPNYSAALRLAADQAEEITTQREQLQLAAPAVAFVEKFVDSTGLKGFRQVCKLLNANEADFRTFLEDKKIMYKLGGEWTPHAQHLDTGRFSVKAGTSEVSGHAFNSARFTPKGVNWVAGEWAKYNLQLQIEVAA